MIHMALGAASFTRCDRGRVRGGTCECMEYRYCLKYIESRLCCCIQLIASIVVTLAVFLRAMNLQTAALIGSVQASPGWPVTLTLTAAAAAVAATVIPTAPAAVAAVPVAAAAAVARLAVTVTAIIAAVVATVVTAPSSAVLVPGCSGAS